MRFTKPLLFISALILLNSCASSYQTLHPKSMNFKSSSVTDEIVLEYKYDLLKKKYAKKENKKQVKLVAVKVTNNSEQDIRFGDDVKLGYANGSKAFTLTKNQTFDFLKQKTATHLLYLLLTPINLITTSDTGQTIETKSIPIGLAIGPGLTAANMITAGSANKNFKNDLFTHTLEGTLIAPGKTVHGLIGIKSSSHEALKLIFEESQQKNDTTSLDTMH